MKNKLLITIISVIFLISCLCIFVNAHDYTNYEPDIDGYTVVSSEFGNLHSIYYQNSFRYHFCEYSLGSNRITTYDFLINFNLFQADYINSYIDYGNWLNNNGINEVTPLTWKNYILSSDSFVNDFYLTINSSSAVFANIEETLNSYSNFAYTLYYIAQLEINAENDKFEIERITTEYNSLYTQKETLETENSELQAQVVELQAQKETLEIENSELQAQVGELQAQKETLEIENSELQSQVGTLEFDNSELQAQVGELQAQKETLEIENVSLREQLNSVDGYQDGYNQALNDTNAFKKGILFIMSSPVVIFSNMFNYDIFGINLFHIIQVLFTVLVVSFAFGLIFKYIL